MAAEEQLLAQLEAARAEVAALEAALDVAQLPTASTAAVLPQPLQYSPLFSDRATNWMTHTPRPAAGPDFRRVRAGERAPARVSGPFSAF